MRTRSSIFHGKEDFYFWYRCALDWSPPSKSPGSLHLRGGRSEFKAATVKSASGVTMCRTAINCIQLSVSVIFDNLASYEYHHKGTFTKIHSDLKLHHCTKSPLDTHVIRHLSHHVSQGFKTTHAQTKVGGLHQSTFATASAGQGVRVACLKHVQKLQGAKNSRSLGRCWWSM